MDSFLRRPLTQSRRRDRLPSTPTVGRVSFVVESLVRQKKTGEKGRVTNTFSPVTLSSHRRGPERPDCVTSRAAQVETRSDTTRLTYPRSPTYFPPRPFPVAGLRLRFARALSTLSF